MEKWMPWAIGGVIVVGGIAGVALAIRGTGKPSATETPTTSGESGNSPSGADAQTAERNKGAEAAPEALTKAPEYVPPVLKRAEPMPPVQTPMPKTPIDPPAHGDIDALLTEKLPTVARITPPVSTITDVTAVDRVATAISSHATESMASSVQTVLVEKPHPATAVSAVVKERSFNTPLIEKQRTLGGMTRKGF